MFKLKGLNKALIGGSIVLLIMFNIFNALNFFYHFAMARFLSIADYGTLATLFSIIYIISILTESVQTIVTRYSSREDNPGKLKNLLLKSFGKASKISIILFAAYLAVAIPLHYFLKISYPLMAFNGFIIFAALFSPIARGVMQGRKMFTALGVNMIIESGIKFVLAIVLVLIGWKVYGAIAANMIGVIIAILFAYFPLKKIIKSNEIKMSLPDIYVYSKPVLILITIIFVFYSLDLIIAKIVFSPEVAGYYAIASMIGKIIFFGTEPIAKAMFPLSAEDKSKKGEKSSNVFFNAFGFLLICIVVALLAYYFFGDWVVRIYAGQFIPQSAGILFYVGMATSLLSLVNLVLLYKVSAGKITRGYWMFLMFLAVEIALLFYFSHNLVEFSLAYVAASAFFFWGSVFLLREREG